MKCYSTHWKQDCRGLEQMELRVWRWSLCRHMEQQATYEPWLQRLLDLLRSDSWNDRFEAFEDPLDDLVHIFSETARDTGKIESDDRFQRVAAFYRDWRDEIWAGVLLACANLSTNSGSLLIYPGVMLSDMIREAFERPSQGATISVDEVTQDHGCGLADVADKGKNPSRVLLLRVKKRNPQGWAELVSSLLQLQVLRRNGWPPSYAAARVLQCIREIWPTWAAVVAEAQGELAKNRQKRKDPALMRAFAWLGLLEWLMKCLASPLGPLRLLMEYMFSLIEYYEKSLVVCVSSQSPNKSAADALVLEVLSLLGSHMRLVDIGERPVGTGAERPSPPMLGTRGQGSNTIRKRVQRARLKAATNRRCPVSRGTRVPDTQWVLLVADLQAIVASQGDSERKYAPPR